MGVILVYPTSGGGGASHSHSNLATLEKIAIDDNGKFLFDDKVIENAEDIVTDNVAQDEDVDELFDNIFG